MASFDKKGAAGGAASGAAAGSVFGPYGTAAGAVIGGVAGGFLGGKKYKSPHFSDIDLQRENPELWAQLQQLNSLADAAEANYQRKVQNDAAIQARDVNQGLTSLNDRLANSGLIGTSAGLSNSVDAEARLREQVARKAYEEQEMARQAAQSARQNYIQNYAAAQKDVFAPIQQQALADFEYSQGQNQAMMNGFGSLAGALGQQRNQQLMAEQRADDRNFYMNLYGNRSPASAPSPVYSGPQGYTAYSGIPGSTMYPGGANYPAYNNGGW